MPCPPDPEDAPELLKRPAWLGVPPGESRLGEVLALIGRYEALEARRRRLGHRAGTPVREAIREVLEKLAAIPGFVRLVRLCEAEFGDDAPPPVRSVKKLIGRLKQQCRLPGLVEQMPLTAALDRLEGRAARSTETRPDTDTQALAAAPPPARKRSSRTDRGGGRMKLIAALTRHHRYADGGCLNLEPIGNNALAKAAKVSNATASAFFRDRFQGHAKYQALCRDASGLVTALKMLNGEYSPYILYERCPADGDNRDEE